jgi:adenylylsulfate kinase-like enzyme
MVGPDEFVEVYFDTPPDVSAARKASRTKRPPLVKRIRRSVRKVRWPGRTSSSFQVPNCPDLVLGPALASPADNALTILELLEERGFLARREDDPASGGDQASSAVAASYDDVDEVPNEGTI